MGVWGIHREDAIVVIAILIGDLAFQQYQKTGLEI